MNNLETQFVQAMWSALTDDANFQPMLSAWDNMFEQGLVSTEGESLVAKLEQDLVRLEAAFTASIQARRQPIVGLNDTDDLLIIIDRSGELAFESNGFRHLELNKQAFKQQLKELDLDSDEAQFIWGQVNDSHSKMLLALVPVGRLRSGSREYLVQSIGTRWLAAYDGVVLSLFPLTPTELAVLKELYQGLDSADIAELRGRSVHTIRSQVKSILEKFGVNNQRVLIRLLSSVFHLHDKNRSKLLSTASSTRHTVELSSSQCLEYCDYGVVDGPTIFFISPTLSPLPSHYLRSIALAHKVRVVAPFRPGSGETSNRSSACGPEVIAHDYLELINLLGITKPILLGYASGGLYAMCTAALLKQNCAGVATIDTGYPFSTISSMLSMPSGARRTFMAARINRKLLYAPHRIAANDFFSSVDGERRLVQYFFENQPHDLERVKSDDYFYRAVRDLIRFSFENIERLVDDVSHWAQDWQAIAEQLDSQLPKLAIIGEQNQMYRAPKLIRWCERNGWSCEVVEREGQLLVFSQPEQILTLLSKHFINTPDSH